MKKSKPTTTTTSSSSSSSMNIHHFTHDLLNPDLISRFTSSTPPSSSSSSPSKSPSKVNIIDCFDSNLYQEPTTNARYVDIQGDQEDTSNTTCITCGQIDIIDFLTKQCYLCNQKTISTTPNTLFTLLNQTNPTSITIPQTINHNISTNINTNNILNNCIQVNSINKKRSLEEKYNEKHEENNPNHIKLQIKSPKTLSTNQITNQITSKQSFSHVKFPLNLFPFLQTSTSSSSLIHDQTLIIPNDEDDDPIIEDIPTKQTIMIPMKEDTLHRLCKHCHQIKLLKDFEPRRRVCLSCRNKKKVESAHAKILERLLEQTKQCNELIEPSITTTSSSSNTIKEPIYFEFPKPHRGNLPIECHECKQPFSLETCHLFRYRVDVCKYRSQCYSCYNNKNYHYKSRKLQKMKESVMNDTGLSEITPQISNNNHNNNSSGSNINNYSPLISITIPVSVNNTNNTTNNNTNNNTTNNNINHNNQQNHQNNQQLPTNIISNPNTNNK